MITIAQAVEQIIKNKPIYQEGLVTGLINISSLARKIKIDVEKKTFKKVTAGAVIMAIKRLEKEIRKKNAPSMLASFNPDMIVRSNLFEYTIKNSSTLIQNQKKLLEEFSSEHQHFLTVTTGVFETTFIASDALYNRIASILKNEQKVGEIKNLSSVTIKLTPEIVKTPGVYAAILKKLAWEGINITEVVSTYLELTIIIKNSEVDKAFSILKS